MITFNSYPPQSPEDIEFTDGTALKIEAMEDGVNDEDRMSAIGEIVGRLLYTNMQPSSSTAARELGMSLAATWDRDSFFHAFEAGITYGIDHEVALEQELDLPDAPSWSI